MTTVSSPAADRRARARRSRPFWPAATGLIVLGLLPILARRLAAIAEQTGGAAPSETPLATALPVFLHVGSAVLFVVLGPFQFSPRFRRRRLGWHRVAGRLLVVAGLVVALSGLWLTQFYPPTEGAGLLYAFRLFFGLAMVFSIVWGFRAILRRDVARHRAWMIRAYAISLGAGTQLFTLGFGQALFGTGQLTEALLNAAGWGINLSVAEWVIRRGRSRSRRRVPASATSALSARPVADAVGHGRPASSAALR